MSLRFAEHVRDCVAFGADVGQGLKGEPGLYALNDGVANLFKGRGVLVEFGGMMYKLAFL